MISNVLFWIFVSLLLFVFVFLAFRSYAARFVINLLFDHLKELENEKK